MMDDETVDMQVALLTYIYVFLFLWETVQPAPYGVIVLLTGDIFASGPIDVSLRNVRLTRFFREKAAMCDLSGFSRFALKGGGFLVPLSRMSMNHTQRAPQLVPWQEFFGLKLPSA